jgi:hypothetical protein
MNMTVLQDLIDSRDLLIRGGYTAHYLRMDGRHCAVGAVLDATGNEDIHAFIYNTMNERGAAVIRALNATLPEDFQPHLNSQHLGDIASRVAGYNNRRGEEAVIAMFNSAIAREETLVSA